MSHNGASCKDLELVTKDCNSDSPDHDFQTILGLVGPLGAAAAPRSTAAVTPSRPCMDMSDQTGGAVDAPGANRETGAAGSTGASEILILVKWCYWRNRYILLLLRSYTQVYLCICMLAILTSLLIAK